MDPKNPANNSKGKLFQAKYPWKWTNLSMRENDINDMAMDDMCAIVHQLPLLEKLDIEGNLFYRVRKFNEVVSMLRADPNREVVPIIHHINVHPYKLLQQ